MKLAVICSLRDAAGFLPLWRRMIAAWTVQPTAIVIAENDSVDQTAEILRAWAEEDARVHVVHFALGEPMYPRAPTRERVAYLAKAWTRAIDAAVALPSWNMAYVTSVQKHTGPDIVEALMAHDLDIVAAMPMFNGVFYDTWCFQDLDGGRWGNDRRPRAQLTEVAGIGGTYLVQRPVYAAGCRPRATDGRFCESVAFCAEARAAGFRVWVDETRTTTATHDPATFGALL